MVCSYRPTRSSNFVQLTSAWRTANYRSFCPQLTSLSKPMSRSSLILHLAYKSLGLFHLLRWTSREYPGRTDLLLLGTASYSNPNPAETHLFCVSHALNIPCIHSRQRVQTGKLVNLMYGPVRTSLGVSRLSFSVIIGEPSHKIMLQAWSYINIRLYSFGFLYV